MKKYICLKTFAADPEQYGIDFIEGNVYYGEYADDKEDGFYMESTENGTDVLLSEAELERYFKSL